MFPNHSILIIRSKHHGQFYNISWKTLEMQKTLQSKFKKTAIMKNLWLWTIVVYPRIHSFISIKRTKRTLLILSIILVYRCHLWVFKHFQCWQLYLKNKMIKNDNISTLKSRGLACNQWFVPWNLVLSLNIIRSKSGLFFVLQLNGFS